MVAIKLFSSLTYNYYNTQSSSGVGEPDRQDQVPSLNCANCAGSRRHLTANGWVQGTRTDVAEGLVLNNFQPPIRGILRFREPPCIIACNRPVNKSEVLVLPTRGVSLLLPSHLIKRPGEIYLERMPAAELEVIELCAAETQLIGNDLDTAYRARQGGGNEANEASSYSHK